MTDAVASEMEQISSSDTGKRAFQLPGYVMPIVILTLANLAVLGMRNVIVGDTFFNFLKSNLFIGSFPVILLAFILDMYSSRLNNFFFWAITLVWVLFYPNAPYMISDLIHDSQDPVDTTHKSQVVYDTLIIFSIAMLSIFYGVTSLQIMRRLFGERYSMRFADIAIGATIVLSCLGFYMGRELMSAIDLMNGYMYSWEIFLEPVLIIKAVWNSLMPIQDHLDGWAMMFLIGFVQVCLLFIFRNFTRNTPVKL